MKDGGTEEGVDACSRSGVLEARAAGQSAAGRSTAAGQPPLLPLWRTFCARCAQALGSR